ncbi:sensor histidine kinase [Azospirillum doebereinerae]|uniref:histidine kinase n=1 Tax=Azospirillum doebereinerae TaxID=92933 RepID=A0A3S0XN84_9PROT|nr:histidine kinase dimerization/phosphoacceptor domain -containing protein [Azospirillum doebereinerae]RUQ72060.1 GAF domain-containing protein [Azospirillum doebereinerae]
MSKQVLNPDATIAKLRHHHHALQDYSRLLASYIPLANLLPLTAYRLVRGAGVTHSMVLRFDGDRGDLVMEAGTGWRAGSTGTSRFVIDAASPSGRTYQTRIPTCVLDLVDSAELRTPDLLREHGVRSLVVVPVISGGAVWGLLEMGSTEPGRFDADDERFLLAMGNILGVAIERASDQEAARAAVARAKAAASEETEAQTLRLSEMQHRMKNNLALVSSILMLEQHQHGDAYVKERLRGLMDRVTAIGLAHEQLSAHQEDALVELAPYVGRLAENLGLQHSGVRIETGIEAITVPLDHAVPLGLIVNELMTNAVKYAFPDGVGTIRIALRCDQTTKEATLSVADDGVGMGPPRPGSLGTRLINGLAGQIGGTVTRPPVERGATVEVRFPIVT